MATRRVRRGAGAIRERYSRSWITEFRAHLKAVDFFDRTTVIGAELLWSALPLIIVLSSFANHRVDSDISRHIGLNRQGAHIVAGLFRGHPSHAAGALATGVIISFAGVISVIQSIQVVYERLYGFEHRGWRDWWRYCTWLAVLAVLLVLEAQVQASAHDTPGEILQDVVTFAIVCALFTWTIRFLLHGQVPWSDAFPSALATALLWVVLAVASSAYFSPMIVDDSKTYGTIGAVFTFLTWFILIASVIVLGAALGAVWLNRRSEAGQLDLPGPSERP